MLLGSPQRSSFIRQQVCLGGSCAERPESAPQLLVKNLQFEDGKMIPASKYFSSGESSSVELNEEEMKIAAEIKAGLPVEAGGESGAAVRR